jgi:hypothetical protein
MFTLYAALLAQTRALATARLGTLVLVKIVNPSMRVPMTMVAAVIIQFALMLVQTWPSAFVIAVTLGMEHYATSLMCVLRKQTVAVMQMPTATKLVLVLDSVLASLGLKVMASVVLR